MNFPVTSLVDMKSFRRRLSRFLAPFVQNELVCHNGVKIMGADNPDRILKDTKYKIAVEKKSGNIKLKGERLEKKKGFDAGMKIVLR